MSETVEKRVQGGVYRVECHWEDARRRRALLMELIWREYRGR